MYFDADISSDGFKHKCNVIEIMQFGLSNNPTLNYMFILIKNTKKNGKFIKSFIHPMSNYFPDVLISNASRVIKFMFRQLSVCLRD